MTSPANITPWELIKQAIKAQLPNQEYTTWVAPLECTNVSANQLFIKAPNILFYQRIHDSYLPLIEKIKAELGLDQYFIQFDTLNPIEGVDEEPETCDYAVTPTAGNFADDTKPTMTKQNHEGHLNPLYTFENFVKGSSNQFALSTCWQYNIYLSFNHI